MPAKAHSNRLLRIDSESLEPLVLIQARCDTTDGGKCLARCRITFECDSYHISVATGKWLRIASVVIRINNLEPLQFIPGGCR
jgi:hypothetical protein